MAQSKHKVQVEVTVEGTGDDAELVSVKVEGGQAIPIPKDVPAPRRLGRELVKAALQDDHPANRDGDKGATPEGKATLPKSGGTSPFPDGKSIDDAKAGAQVVDTNAKK